MKKGNRVLTMFLAAVMLFTSIAWDFGDAAVAEAETTSAITETEDSVSIDFDNIDVAELDAAGFTSTKFANEQVVAGEVGEAVSKHWFSGDGDDTPYGDGEGKTVTAKNIGLKTRDIEADGTRTFMYTPYTYEDFQVSAEIYYGSYSGIVIGEKNTFPVTDGTASSVAVFLNGGNVQVEGAVTNSTAKLMRGNTNANIANYGNTPPVGMKLFNVGSKEAINNAKGEVVTLNVKKTGDHLIIWVSDASGVMTIQLSEGYKTGWIGIQSVKYDADGGGFKSLDIQKVHATEHHELDNASMTDLDNQAYTVTSGSKGEVGANGLPTTKIASVGDVFFSGETNGTVTTNNNGMKAKVVDSSIEALNIPYIYDNFRLEAEVYTGHVVGVAAGAATTSPSTGSSTTMITSFFSANNSGNGIILQTGGAYSGMTRTGGIAGFTSAQFRPSSGGVKLPITKDVVYTIVLEVNNGTLKVWLKGCDGYVTANIASTHITDKISLIARNNTGEGGAFKSYTITNLDAGDYAEFDNVYLQNLDAASYKARIGSSDSELQFVSESALWFSGDKTNYSAEEANKNEGLKPNNTDSKYELLNMPHTYENFRLKANVYHGQVVGVKIGVEAKNPQIGGGTPTTGSVSIYINGKNIAIAGAIDWESRQMNNAAVTSKKDGFVQYEPVGNSALWNQARTLIIEVQNGILSVGFEDLDHVARVKLHSSYQAGSIALFARQYDTNSKGEAGGGFKGYEIEKLPDTYNIGATVDLEDYTEFANVNIAKLEEKGFTSTRFETSGDRAIVGTADAPVSTHWMAGNTNLSSTGVVATSGNVGLKPNTAGEDYFTVLNTPYTNANGYDNYRVSMEVYWGATTSIILGDKNVYPSSATNTVRIYFNANQIQVDGGGFDPDTAVVSGGATWSEVFAPTYIFKPVSDFTVSDGAVYKLNAEMQNGALTIWVDGYEGMLSLNTKKTFSNEGIALGARQYDSQAGGLKSLTVEKLTQDIAIPYTADEFAEFRSESGLKAPEYKNYLFAGWYTDAACDDYTKAVPYNATTTDVETVYAKFVPRYVMTVKAQISAELLDDNLKNDTTGQIRFATTVDSENYSLAGFKVSYDKDGDGTPTDIYSTSKTVWTELTAIGNMTYEPNDFCQISKYFKTCVVKPFADTYFDMEFEVTPCWRTLDGTYVYGDTVVKTVNQGVNIKALDGKTALFLGDSIQNGSNFEKVEGDKLLAWYQRLAHYYGMVTEEVASKGWTLIDKAITKRGGHIVSQLEEAKQTSYDFVILEGGVNDVLMSQESTTVSIDWGTINEDANATFSNNNIAGAMQDLIVKTQAKFPDAEIVYIINHYFRATDENMEKYVAMVKAACRVHDISYVDLSDVDAYPSLAPLTQKSAEYIPDNLHPNAAGYELSTPVIANHLRKLLTGEFTKTVYVASTGTDAKGYGTVAEPYQSLNYAMSKVADDGTVYVQDALTCVNANSTTSFSMGGYGVETGKNIESKTNIIDKVNHKQVTIAGASDTAKLEFPVDGTTYLLLNDSVILKDIQVQWPSRIFAEGNTFIIEDSVKQVGSKEPMLVGGSSYHNVDKTDLRIYAGIYSKIIGGQLGGDKEDTVGETNVIVGGKVNEGVDITTHNHTRILLGGNYSEGGNCTVIGDTNVIVEQGARFDYVFGAGAKQEGTGDGIVCAVQGDTNVTFAGEAYAVYGGACGRLGTKKVDTKVTCVNTNVTILEGAKAEQVFGGSEHASISGNANVNLLGGTIDRRVWGGCYNEEEPATYYANGTVTVTISPNVTLETWHGMAAVSRFNKTSSSTETGIFIFTDYTNNSTNIGKISAGFLTNEGDKTHDHLVKVGVNGTVKVVDGKLVVTPNSGYTATVTGATDNEDGTYTMTAKDIVVTFN